VPLLDGAHQVGGGVGTGAHPDLHQHPGGDRVAAGGVDDLGRLEDLLEMADAGLVEALLVLGRVVVGVLADVAVLACPLDALRDLTPVRARPVRQLVGQPRCAWGVSCADGSMDRG